MPSHSPHMLGTDFNCQFYYLSVQTCCELRAVSARLSRFPWQHCECCCRYLHRAAGHIPVHRGHQEVQACSQDHTPTTISDLGTWRDGELMWLLSACHQRTMLHADES